MAVNQDIIINRLVEARIIERAYTRGHYYVVGVPRPIFWRREKILQRFAIEVEPGKYELNAAAIAEALSHTLRTLTRASYHSQERPYDEALARIPLDADGVRRSFGLEYEIYALTAEQESKLAYLLDTLPEHVVERDGSLSSSGCEIVFMPMSKEQYITTVKKLYEFVTVNDVQMSGGLSGAGMHTTYGIWKEGFEYPEKRDLQIRLNRYALAVKAVGTQRNITKLFGRDFGTYRTLPTSTTVDTHQNAFSTNGRPNTCWECRLPAYNCDVEKLVEFLIATETVFTRPTNGSDFDRVFRLLGDTTCGE